MLITALFGASTLAYGGDDLTSLSYISYLERYATVHPASGDEALDAQVNMPILVGDRLDTARGARVEVPLADGCILWVNEFTTVDFDAIVLSRDADSRRTVLNIVAGGVAIEIPSTASLGDNVRVDSRRGSVFLSRPGLYRLDVERDELHVEVHAGLAELPVGLGSSLLRGGQQAWLEDDDNNDFTRASLDEDYDDFWAWVEERRTPRSGGRTGQYVEGRHGSRAAVLDTYGEWVYVSTYSSWAWRPRVSVTWRPYSLGRWYWTPVGWSWVSYEPWGWYPYHYGSWYWDAGYGWLWSWDWVWGPAWVHWMWADGYLGWCPRGYYDWWYWGHRHQQYRGRWPDRWSHAAFDFSGRVRMRDVDPRPWTFVPGDRFGSPHIDRVRVDTERVLREIGNRSDGIVRSGPLVTRTPGRELADRGVGDVIRREVGDRQPPDLGAVLRRDAEGLTRIPGEREILAPSRTVDLVSRTLPSRTVETRSTDSRDATRERPDGSGRLRVDRDSSTQPTTRRDLTDQTGPGRNLTRVSPGTPGQAPTDRSTTERSLQRPEGETGRTGPSQRPSPRTDAGRSTSPPSPGSSRSEPVNRPGSGTTRPDPPTRSVPPAPPQPPARSDAPSRSEPPTRSDQPSRPDPPSQQRNTASHRAFELPDRSAYRIQDALRSTRQGRNQTTLTVRTQPGPESSRSSGRPNAVSPNAGGSRLDHSSRRASSSPAGSGSVGSSWLQSWPEASRLSSRSQASSTGRSTSPASSSRATTSSRLSSGSSGGSSSAGRSYSTSGSSSSRSFAGSSSSRSPAGSPSSGSSAGSSSSRSAGSSSSSSSRSSSGSSGSGRGGGSNSRHR